MIQENLTREEVFSSSSASIIDDDDDNRVEKITDVEKGEKVVEPKVGRRTSISFKRGCQRCRWRGTLAGSKIGI